MAADVVWFYQSLRFQSPYSGDLRRGVRRLEGDYERRREIPSSRTSIIAIVGGGVEASRFEELCARSSSERDAAERRGRLATVCIDILKVLFIIRESSEALVLAVELLSILKSVGVIGR
jgi:hypothetical protein